MDKNALNYIHHPSTVYPPAQSSQATNNRQVVEQRRRERATAHLRTVTILLIAQSTRDLMMRKMGDDKILITTEKRKESASFYTIFINQLTHTAPAEMVQKKHHYSSGGQLIGALRQHYILFRDLWKCLHLWLRLQLDLATLKVKFLPLSRVSYLWNFNTISILENHESGFGNAYLPLCLSSGPSNRLYSIEVKMGNNIPNEECQYVSQAGETASFIIIKGANWWATDQYRSNWLDLPPFSGGWFGLCGQWRLLVSSCASVIIILISSVFLWPSTCGGFISYPNPPNKCDICSCTRDSMLMRFTSTKL